MHSGGRDDLATASKQGQQLCLDATAGRGMSTLDSSNSNQKETDNNEDEHSCSDYEEAGEWSSSSDGSGEAGSGSADLPLMPAPSWVPDHTFKVSVTQRCIL